MYIANTPIYIYFISILIAMFTGNIAGFVYSLYNEDKIGKDKEKYNIKRFFSEMFSHKPFYLFMLVNSILYVTLIYIKEAAQINDNAQTFQIFQVIIKNLDIIKYMVLLPMLESAFMIDIKKHIIPNRLNLAIFESGLIFTFIQGLIDVSISIDMIFALIASIAIFGVITLVGGIMYGKDAMGMGDIKLVASLALYFGLDNIINLTIVSFLIGAIVSIVLIISKKKDSNEYIAFGPFLVLASIIIIFVKPELIQNVLMNIFTLGYYSRR